MSDLKKPKKPQIVFLQPGKENLEEYTIRGKKRQNKTKINMENVRTRCPELVAEEKKIAAIEPNFSPKGRSTLYKVTYPEQMLKFFNREYTKVIETEKGAKVIANDFPTFEGFAKTLGISVIALIQWRDKFQEFGAAYRRCKEIQKDFLIQNGLHGLTDPRFTMFLARSMTDLRETIYTENVNTTKHELDNASKQILVDALKATGKQIEIDSIEYKTIQSRDAAE